MAMIDPERERARLTAFYSQQRDDKLEQVAAQGSDLTELAREVPRAELSKRGLYIGQLEMEPPEASELAFRDLVTIRSFWNLVEAELVKGLLDAAGIESFLFDDNMVRQNWFNANALGGVKLRVDGQNVEAANRVLEENVSQDAPTDEQEPSA